MGSGFAKALFTKYPIVREQFYKFSGPAYTQRNSGGDLLGSIQFVQVTDELVVVNLYTQQFFGRDESRRYTSYDAIDTALMTLRGFLDQAEQSEVDIHHPLIGSGLGGAHWPIVAAIIEHRLGPDSTLWVLP